MKLLYQGNEIINKRALRRELLLQGAIEFLSCAAIFCLLALFTIVMFLF